MEEHLKKQIMLGVIGGCLVLAGLITLMTRPRKMGIPAKCRDPNCAAEYQITKKDYYVHREKNTELWAMEAPGLICKKCGKKSVYEAVKCEKCELVSEVYSVVRNVRRSFRDKCPKCGYSKIKEDRERQRARKLRKKTAQVSGDDKSK
jgi:hypothetical protein